jgi:hypothetical protein
VLSLAPYPKEIALAEQDTWSNLTLQFHEAAQQTNTEVRVGYFGVCARLIDKSDWECTKNGESVFARFGPDATDTIDILRLAANFKSDVIFPGLMSVDLDSENVDIANVCVASGRWLCWCFAASDWARTSNGVDSQTVAPGQTSVSIRQTQLSYDCA